MHNERCIEDKAYARLTITEDQSTAAAVVLVGADTELLVASGACRRRFIINPNCFPANRSRLIDH